ncbi:hypothetical protein [Geopsychrobacter electrodiphilus]|uniref:hypothetical protein n=1 Tax=Geopsychrobacter electrodiphilus TaxID=225196 RepID=UPI00036024DC|nr:hypothetical protein [Geopsychrobacter electrodiphilus]
MKKIIIFALFLMVFVACGMAWAGPFAPMAKLDDKFKSMVQPKDREVPDAAEVVMPAYPNSQFCTIDPDSSGPEGWREVQLLSTDPYAKVSAWYREKMSDWHCLEETRGMSFSCSDENPDVPGQYNPETSNVVEVVKINVPIPCVLPGMQTGIFVRFQPD